MFRDMWDITLKYANCDRISEYGKVFVVARRAIMEFYIDKLLFLEKGLEGFRDFNVNINFFLPYFELRFIYNIHHGSFSLYQ